MQLRKLTPIGQAFVLSVLAGIIRKPLRDGVGGDEDFQFDEKSEYISGTDIVKDIIIVQGYAGDCQEFLFGAGIHAHEHRKLSWPRIRRHKIYIGTRRFYEPCTMHVSHMRE
jgi:hypothetical protein